jgi:phosphoglucosamine mutase
MVRFPQVLINVKNVAKERLSTSTVIADAVKAAEDELGSNGRVLLRASGTEPLVRVWLRHKAMPLHKAWQQSWRK